MVHPDESNPPSIFIQFMVVSYSLFGCINKYGK